MDDVPGAAGEVRRTGGEAVSGLPRFQFVWSAFDFLVRRRFGASTPIDKETGFADPAGVRAQAARHLLPEAEAEFPPVIYETDFVHLDWRWRPYADVLKDVPREAEFLREVSWFFDEFCRSNEYTLAGVEEPRTAARRFSRVNYFTLGDDIRIDVKDGDLYVRKRQSGEWALIYSELAICPSEHFNELSATMNDLPRLELHAAREGAPLGRARSSVASQGRKKSGGARLFEVYVDSCGSPAEFLPLSRFSFADTPAYQAIANAVEAFRGSSEERQVLENLDDICFEGIDGSSADDKYGYRAVVQHHRTGGPGSYRIVVPGLGQFEGLWQIPEFIVVSRKDELNQFNLSLIPDGPIAFTPLRAPKPRGDLHKISEAWIPVTRVNSGTREALPIAEAIESIATGIVRPLPPDMRYWAGVAEKTGISLKEAHDRFVNGYPDVPGYSSLQQLADAVGCMLPAANEIRSVSTRARVEVFGPIDTQGGYLKPPTWHGIADERRVADTPQLSIPGVDPLLTQRFFEAYIPFLARAARFHFFQLMIHGQLVALGDDPNKRSAHELIVIGRRVWSLKNVIVDATHNTVSEIAPPEGTLKLLFSNIVIREDAGFKVSGEDRARDFIRRMEATKPNYRANKNSVIARDMLDSGEFPGYTQGSLQTILTRVNPKAKS